MPERRTDIDGRERLEEIGDGYRSLGRRTTAILAALFVVQLGLGGLSISLSARQDQTERNTQRIDAAVCAEVHYLERGLMLTGLDPKQSIVHNELEVLLSGLRPLVPDCPPAKPFTPPGPAEGAWENPP